MPFVGVGEMETCCLHALLVDFVEASYCPQYETGCGTFSAIQQD